MQMKTNEQYFPVVLFIMLCKGVTFSDNKRWINFVAKTKMQMQSIDAISCIWNICILW